MPKRRDFCHPLSRVCRVHTRWCKFNAGTRVQDANLPPPSEQQQRQTARTLSREDQTSRPTTSERGAKRSLTLLGLPQALDESHGLALEAAGHPAPCASVHELHELLQGMNSRTPDTISHQTVKTSHRISHSDCQKCQAISVTIQSKRRTEPSHSNSRKRPTESVKRLKPQTIIITIRF